MLPSLYSRAAAVWRLLRIVGLSGLGESTIVAGSFISFFFNFSRVKENDLNTRNSSVLNQQFGAAVMITSNVPSYNFHIVCFYCHFSYFLVQLFFG